MAGRWKEKGGVNGRSAALWEWLASSLGRDGDCAGGERPPAQDLASGTA